MRQPCAKESTDFCKTSAGDGAAAVDGGAASGLERPSSVRRGRTMEEGRDETPDPRTFFNHS
jgi:hypothetical protein